MLCERCKKNEATFYYHENVNGNKKTYRLCRDCANELEKSGEIRAADDEKSIFDSFDSFMSDPFGQMNALLSGMFPGGDKKQLSSADKEEKKCPVCGMTFREFARNGMAGCPACYETFAEELKPAISRVHGHSTHSGRVPMRLREKYDTAKRIAELEAERDSAVKAENYERAAEIRDELKKLREGDTCTCCCGAENAPENAAEQSENNANAENTNNDNTDGQ